MDVERVGVRELRNNLKEYLEQVEQGASIEITKNGRTIGMLVPRPDDDAVDRLVTQGRLLPPRSGRIGTRLPRRVLPSPGGPAASEVLQELRGAE